VQFCSVGAFGSSRDLGVAVGSATAAILAGVFSLDPLVSARYVALAGMVLLTAGQSAHWRRRTASTVVGL